MESKVRVFNELRFGPFPRLDAVMAFDVAVDWK
jgi:hypothetical protein